MRCYTHCLLVLVLFFSSACFGQTYNDYFNKGKAEKDLTKKINYYTLALSEKLTDSAFYFRGLAKHNHGKYAEAIADYDQAIQFNPNFDAVYVSRGRAKGTLKRYEEALTDLDIATTLNKTNDYAYSSVGMIKRFLGEYADAVIALNKAIELDPNYSQYYLERGWGFSGLEKRTEAIADFERAIKLEPGFYDGYYASGIEKVLLGRYQDAIPDFDKAIKLAPKAAPAYNGRGVAKEGLEKFAAAVADYEQAIQLDPKFELAIKNRNRVMGLRSASAANQYNAEPLGFKLGVTPLSAVQQKDSEMEEDGYSKWTDGKKFVSKGSIHNIEGAKRITYIFNEKDLLDVVIITMDKDYFNQVNSYVKSKYKLHSANVPPVGNKHSKYLQGNSIIELDAPHLSFEMEVIYKTVAFDTALRTKLLKEKINKTTEQKSKF